MPIKFKDIFKKKKPIDVFGNIKKPHLEESYIKFPGKKLKPISKKRGTHSVRLNMPLLEKLQKKYGKEYTEIHTHPEANFIPSYRDLINFLASKNGKTSIIVPLYNNKPSGYFVMKKNRNYKLSEANNAGFEDAMQSYDKSVLSAHPRKIAANLKNLSQKYNFNYRFFPAKGAILSKEYEGFKNSRQSLETKLSIISLLFLSLSILFGSSGITGYAISEVSINTSNIISVSLFVAGLYSSVLVFFFRDKI